MGNFSCEHPSFHFWFFPQSKGGPSCSPWWWDVCDWDHGHSWNARPTYCKKNKAEYDHAIKSSESVFWIFVIHLCRIVISYAYIFAIWASIIKICRSIWNLVCYLEIKTYCHLSAHISDAVIVNPYAVIHFGKKVQDFCISRGINLTYPSNIVPLHLKTNWERVSPSMMNITIMINKLYPRLDHKSIPWCRAFSCLATSYSHTLWKLGTFVWSVRLFCGNIYC